MIRWLITALCLASFLFTANRLPPCFASTEDPSAPTVSSKPAPQEPDRQATTEQTTPVVRFYTWAGNLPKDLMSLHTALSSGNYEMLTQKKLPELTAAIHELQWQVASFSSAPYLQKMKLSGFNKKADKLQIQLVKIENKLTEAITQLSSRHNTWIANKQQLSSFVKQPELATVLTHDKEGELTNNIQEAINLIETRLTPLMVLGRDLTTLQARIQAINASLDHLNRKYIESWSQRTVPTLLSRDFYRQINPELFRETYANGKRFLRIHYALFLENSHYVLISCFLFATFCWAVSRTKGLVSPSSRWYPFASCPIATSLFLLTAVYGFLSKKVDSNFESQWYMIISILTMIVVVRLVRRCFNESPKRLLLIRLALFMITIMLFAALELPQILMLLFVVSTSLVAILIFIFQIRLKSQSISQYIIRNTWGIIPVFLLVSGLAGYDQFAIFSFATLISSVSICLAIWMLFHLICGLLELLLRIIPFALLRENISVIVRNVQPFIALFHVMLALASLAVVLDVYPTVDEAWQNLYTLGFDVIGLHVSPQFMLTIFLVLYSASLISRAVQALLLQEVLPRYNAEKGVQISITRLVHYCILTIGFLVMLKFLGFELHQLTILGGALGVGIGFGLQAVVNNFAGGLILLFERPIKVGDTIQIGTDLGEVKSLGLRSTIIQTFDNSEIVVPNSDLITGQVTNWTLAERKVRVRIPIGVAYGTDVAKVLEFLTNCARAHPLVLNTPRPEALFLAFGASSLDFELRCWIKDYLDKMTAISELNQSIDSEFAANGIEIPFPQTDLRIRSVTPDAAMALGGNNRSMGKAGDTGGVERP